VNPVETSSPNETGRKSTLSDSPLGIFYGVNPMTERWRQIPGFEGLYEVSDKGRVKSVDRVTVSSNGRHYHLRGKILKPTEYRGGYVQVTLRRDGKYHALKVHRAVLYGFHGVSDLHVDHIDSNKKNNCLDNLRFCTARQNNFWMRKKQNNTSKHIGVCWHKRHDKWMASAYKDGKMVHLGYFHDELKASEAYQKFIAKLGINENEKKLN
jgi:hypothetical protein